MSKVTQINRGDVMLPKLLWQPLTLNELTNLDKLAPGNGFNIVSFLTGLLAAWTFLFGPMDTAFIVLVLMMILDYIFGTISAAMKVGLSSDLNRRGVLRKVCFLFTVIVGTLLDKFFNSGTFCRRTIITLLVVNEATSIFEKLETLGIKIPGIRNLLLTVRLKDDNKITAEQFHKDKKKCKKR